ncbi:pentatricopeptide repeat-containing protein At2g40240, mitochondrial-like [Lotus japonicus]|uniref:pentatricopeptide repeat-containing protein At2g40240, mitochondrial-like n=1 Tax=Lotus japonicus TaxID=34305 RepID=UPI00258493D4|nr:pentatricopeptide repeat-containing protein At2g40240, mitochondrial-like [Lotus japonicus]XP_057446482.1 pentatricopeptide repeat-containing protein At2g40240, mitochondrial-like [Lotus japonicus]
MSFLLKRPNNFLNSNSILTFTLRRLTTLAAKPFPDHPTSAYYDELAVEAGTSGDLNALRDILNKRFQDGCFNTKHTFSFITATNLTSTLIDDVVRTLSGLNPGFTRKSAFESLVTRLCKLERADDALQVVESMAVEGSCSPTASTFNPVLSLLTRQKSLDEARRVEERMAGFGLRLDLTAHNMFLMSYCFSGDLEAAAGVLKRIENEGLAADPRTFDALVLGACKAGVVDGAIAVVRRMVEDGVPMLYSTHMCVITTLLRMNCYKQARKYARSFGGKDTTLDTQLLGCLGSKLMMLKKVKEAMLILDEMNQKGLPMGQKLKAFYLKNAGTVNGVKGRN